MEQHDDEQQNLTAAMPMPTVITAIPDDVLADDVFRRVASPRVLALCRCVCRAWRALIDDRRLLRADLLPLSLPALLLCLDLEWKRPELFARPGADVTGHLMPQLTFYIDDHCNGLVLNNCDEVLNPATRQVRLLPECPPSPLWLPPRYFFQDSYLAFDPAESPHYQVFSIPVLTRPFVDKVREDRHGPEDRTMSQSEWPPSPFVLSVFSSATGRWEARSLVRRGGAAGTVKDVGNVLLLDPEEDHVHSACWRGALYVHSRNDFVLRLPLSSDHMTTAYYQVIKPPAEIGGRCGHLGKSKEGVYFAAFDREIHFCVWILRDDDDSCGHMEWILKHRSAYGLALPSSSPRSRSWTLNAFRSQDGNTHDAQEWDSDDDGETTLHTQTGDYGAQLRLGCLEMLAFHPYREIVFMFIKADSGGGVVYAYHLNTSKLEDLGSLFPKDVTPPRPGECNELHSYTLILSCFPYTPCWMGMP